MTKRHSAVREGTIAGVIGATSIVLWFLLIDTLAGRPYYTPTELGRALFSFFGPVDPSSSPSGIILGYTVFHYAVFIGIGMLLAALVHRAEREPSLLAGCMMLFVAFELGFYGLVALLTQAQLLGGFAWYQIGAANLIAAALMGSYLWNAHPALGDELRMVLDGRS
jgi:hypothetical protein